MQKTVKRVLFISISSVERFSNTGVDQLAGYLRRKGYCVDIQYFHKHEPVEEIQRSVLEGYDVYGFSVVGPNYSKCVRVMNFIKENEPECTIFFGGAFATMYYREMLNENENLDYVVLGDGEEPTEALLISLFESKKQNNPNVASKTDLENKRACYSEIVSHHPAYDYYEKDCRSENVKKTHSMLTKTNVCTGHCTFCFERKGKIIYRNIDEIVREIEYVHLRYGVKKFYFCDDDLLDPNDSVIRERIEELCTKIMHLGHKLVLTCFIKAISFKDNEEDKRLLKLMYRAGFSSMFVGIEAANEKDLRIYNKKAKISDNYTIMKLLEEAGIYPIIGFINLNPYSTLESIKTNFDFLVQYNISKVALYISILRPYKNTPIYRMMLRDGLIDKAYSFNDFMNYSFVDKQIEQIADFVVNKIYPYFDNLEIEFEWVEELYYDCLHVNSACMLLQNDIQNIKARQQLIMTSFFHKLYADTDLLWCEKHLDELFGFLREIQPELKELYQKLLELYEAEV